MDMLAPALWPIRRRADHGQILAHALGAIVANSITTKQQGLLPGRDHRRAILKDAAKVEVATEGEDKDEDGTAEADRLPLAAVEKVTGHVTNSRAQASAVGVVAHTSA